MLVSNINEIRRFMPGNVISDFKMIESFVLNTEREFIIPVLGRDLSKELQDQYNKKTLDEQWGELLERVQYPLVNYACHKSLPKNNVTMMNGGAGVIVSGNMEVASQKRIEDLGRSLYEDAQGGIDLLLLFLEEDALTEKPIFAELWKKSKFYYQVQGSLINTAMVFNDYVNINGSRAKFVDLKSHITYCEKIYIRPEMSSELVDYLIDNESKLDDNHVVLQSILRNSLAYYVADRVPELRADYYKENAKLLLNDARNKIFAVPDNYPKFKESSLYAPKNEVTDQSEHWQNGIDKKMFVMGYTPQN